MPRIPPRLPPGEYCTLFLHREDSALEVLKRRYVRDEISREEFEVKRKDLL